MKKKSAPGGALAGTARASGCGTGKVLVPLHVLVGVTVDGPVPPTEFIDEFLGARGKPVFHHDSFELLIVERCHRHVHAWIPFFSTLSLVESVRTPPCGGPES